MNSLNKGKKVYVGLSGGVDSSVSALLLKHAGYEVTGVFIKGWQPDWIPCTWKADRISAMRTAAHLDIPFITLDLEQKYKDKVVNYILKEYSEGRTPNPDMLCNREIKFGAFLKWAKQMGADYVATGHYAQIGETNDTEQNVEMLESVDKEKDQTYFLSQLTQNELRSALFPIGHMVKKDVRKLAEKYRLPVATRKDSQGICFVGDLEMKDFLKKELSPKSGKVLNTQGEVIGEHDGALLYTIGERHGFRIQSKNTERENMYVISKDLKENVLVVSEKMPNSFNDSNTDTVLVTNISLTINDDHLHNAKNLSIRIRYRGEKIPVKLLGTLSHDKVIKLQTSKKLDFAHGQFAVFYDNENCLGGGEL